jgi:hypothetical protein
VIFHHFARIEIVSRCGDRAERYVLVPRDSTGTASSSPATVPRDKHAFGSQAAVDVTAVTCHPPTLELRIPMCLAEALARMNLPSQSAVPPDVRG